MTWNTVSVLCMSQLGSSEWEIQNVFAVFQVGSLLVHCPFICDVLAVFLVGTPLLAPSVKSLCQAHECSLQSSDRVARTGAPCRAPVRSSRSPTREVAPLTPE